MYIVSCDLASRYLLVNKNSKYKSFFVYFSEKRIAYFNRKKFKRDGLLVQIKYLFLYVFWGRLLLIVVTLHWECPTVTVFIYHIFI